MTTSSINHPERLFPANSAVRGIAAELYRSVRDLPIVSPHGHTDPVWFALDEQFPDAVELLLKPDHYLVRMLYSQGIPLESLGIEPLDGSPAETDSRKIWRLFAQNYHLFAGTPSSIWLDHVFNEVFGLETLLSDATADAYFDHINESLGRPEFRPRALFDRFNIEVLATTESPLDSLEHHQTIRDRPGIREFRCQCRTLRRNRWRRHFELLGVPGGASCPAAGLPVDGSDGHRPWTPDGGHGRS
jgi:glucuronate isomerase